MASFFVGAIAGIITGVACAIVYNYGRTAWGNRKRTGGADGADRTAESTGEAGRRAVEESRRAVEKAREADKTVEEIIRDVRSGRIVLSNCSNSEE